MIFNENGDIINEGFIDRLKDSFKSPAQKRAEIMIKSMKNAERMYKEYESRTKNLKTFNPYGDINGFDLSEKEINILANDIDNTCKKLSKMKPKITSIIKKCLNKYKVPEKFVKIYCELDDFDGLGAETKEDFSRTIKDFIKRNINPYFISFTITVIDDVNTCKYFEDNGIDVPLKRHDNPAVNSAYEIAKELKSISGIPSYYSFDWEDDKPIGIELCCDLNQMIKTLINK